MPRLFYLVSEDWYFLSHRLPMARAARAAGWEVHVATRVVNGGAAIAREGFVLHPIPWRRGSTSPFAAIKTIRTVRTLYRRVKPDIVHHVAFAPAVLGSLAALGLPLQKLNALAGLGYVFTSKTAKARVIRPLARQLLRFLLSRPRTTVLVQNPDDRAAITQLGIPEAQIALIPGSGVDTVALTSMPEPEGTFAVGFVGRLLYDKGVHTLVRAQALLQQRGLTVQVIIAGTPDPSNPASVTDKDLDAWRQQQGINFLGQIADVRGVWRQAHVAVLPSRREGLPKSLLEAAACGRPMIASDVPGCREIVRAEVNGVLVSPDDPAALADAIARLEKDRDLRLRFGKKARQIVVEDFSDDYVGRAIVKLYARMVGEPASAAHEEA